MNNKPSPRKMVLALLALVVSLMLALPAEAQKKKKKGYTGTGAGIGALLGLALGNGNILEDTARGAALGAAGGAIASAATKDKREQQAREEEQAQQQESAKEQELAQQQRQLTEQQQQLEELQRELKEVVDARNSMQEDIIDAIGPDAWEGYKALRACQTERAYALANVAATSPDQTHQLAATWLEAMVAVDSRSSERAQAAYERIAKEDPEIDTVQQASLATDQAVLDLRSERHEIGIVCQ